jgi:hypothetical protein
LRIPSGIFPVIAIVAAILASPAAKAQRACPLAPIPTVDPGANMFNTQQEIDLGDAFAEQV